MSQWLQLGSGFAAVAASTLVAFRVLMAVPTPLPALTPAPPPAVYAPVAPVVKAGEVFESESPANGFIVVLETTPDGMAVTIDGASRGETPASLNFECQPPKTMQLKLTHAGYVPIERTVACKHDTMLILKARPEAARKR